MTEAVEVGDVVQITNERPGLVGAFLYVEEMHSWGAEGFVHQVDGFENSARISLRLKTGTFQRVGKAPLQEEEFQRASKSPRQRCCLRGTARWRARTARGPCCGDRSGQGAPLGWSARIGGLLAGYVRAEFRPSGRR